jgi:hypothetical protein
MPSEEETFDPVPAPPSHDVTLSGVDSLFEQVGAESMQEGDVERNGAAAEK